MSKYSKRRSKNMDFEYIKKIQEHYNSIWDNKPTNHRWNKGPIQELPDGFEILKFDPTKARNMWTYATCGMSMPPNSTPLELHIFAPEHNDDLIELLTVVAHYHITGSSLGLGHTVNFGQPWWAKSKCEYGLISLPYLDGPTLECLNINGMEIKFLWLLPITRQEVDYKKKHGLDALEEKFDDLSFNYLNPYRKSVV